MAFVTQHGAIITGLMALPVVIGVVFLFLVAIRRYEIVVGLMMVSTWAHWAFAVNEEMLSPLEAAEETGPGTYLRVAVVLLAGTAGYLRFIRIRWSTFERIPVQLLLLGLFTGGALLSTAYSIDKSFTFVRGAESVFFLGFLLGLHSWMQDMAKLAPLLNVMTAILAVGILLNASSFALFPSRVWWWEAPNRFQGLTNQPNEMGGFCLACYPLLTWRYRRSKPLGKYVMASLLCLVAGMHVLTGSRSSMVCAMVGFLVWALLSRQYKQVAILAGVACVAILAASSFDFASLQRNESDSLTDLTGRDELWRRAMDLIKHRPLLGYGYQVSGKIWEEQEFSDAAQEGNLASARTSLHNGYLDTLIGLGAVGLLAWLCVLLLPIPRVLMLPMSDYKALGIVVLVQFLLLNCVETVITGSRSFASILFWVFWVICGGLPALLSSPGPENAPASAESVVAPAVPPLLHGANP